MNRRVKDTVETGRRLVTIKKTGKWTPDRCPECTSLRRTTPPPWDWWSWGWWERSLWCCRSCRCRWGGLRSQTCCFSERWWWTGRSWFAPVDQGRKTLKALAAVLLFGPFYTTFPHSFSYQSTQWPWTTVLWVEIGKTCTLLLQSYPNSPEPKALIKSTFEGEMPHYKGWYFATCPKPSTPFHNAARNCPRTTGRPYSNPPSLLLWPEAGFSSTMVRAFPCVSTKW